MIPPGIKEYLKELISKQINATISSLAAVGVGGGSINDCFRLEATPGGNFFLKLNSAARFDRLFEKENSGLDYLARHNCIATPRVLLRAVYDNYQLLLLEWIDPGHRSEAFWKKFGEQLAQLHQVTHEHFGFFEDNYMGSLPQENSFSRNWTEFFARRRLQPQIDLAIRKKMLDKTDASQFESLFKKLDTIFDIEKPALLHGDLWNGNFICNSESLPVLIDPAVYFGHRSMDLGMTTLFSGFDDLFYQSYHYHFPFPANYREQWEICNLYPLLIHLNLFGSGYRYEITQTLKKYS